MHNHVFPCGVGFRRGLITLGEIGKGVWSLESCGGLRSAPTVTAVTSDAARLEGTLAVLDVWRFGIFQGLRKQQNGTREQERVERDDATGSGHR